MIRYGLDTLAPSLAEAGKCCLQIIAAAMLAGMVSAFLSGHQHKSSRLIAALSISTILLAPIHALLGLGAETVETLSEYGKLLLPVMTATLAAQGAPTSASVLYAGTACLDAFLSELLTDWMLPMIRLFLCLSIANAAVEQPLLGKLRDLIRWCMTWILKIVLYVFTGFLAVTGVVSGSVDHAALKAAKITISGVVPVVGSILSDASEAVLAGAGIARSAAGAYGILTFLALFLSPFIRIGVQHLLLKAAGGICTSFDSGSSGALIADFSSAMGLILGMIATQTVLLLVSTVCFLKGLG